MTLQSLVVEDFRCVEHAELTLHPRFNLISGENATGKTTLLEAMFILGRGRSFRSSQTEALIRAPANAFQLVAKVSGGDGRSRPLGMRFDRAGMEIRCAGRPIGALAELATILPVQAIDPEVHRLIEGGPQERRRYLDWGVFHVEPTFIGYWRRYQRALRQRNAGLKAAQPEALIRIWDKELVEAGEEVTNLRERYLGTLVGHVSAVAGRLLGSRIDLTLSRGWSADRSLLDATSAAWQRDRARGLTHCGPHRADLVVRFEGSLAKDRVSRGQQKLLAAALLLGQLQCDASLGSELAGLLVDDPAAELDESHLKRLLAEVSALPAQLVVTALDPANPALRELSDGHRFHVEHGSVTRLL
jgi:DNA replication and repair protein RecF